MDKTDGYLSAAPGQAHGDPVDGDLQVVHLAVVIRRRQVVGAEAAEEQSQEEVQQLEEETERERDRDMASVPPKTQIHRDHIIDYKNPLPRAPGGH